MNGRNRKRRYNRRGLALPEWFCLVGLLMAGVFVFWNMFGDPVQEQMNSTGAGVADPSQLLNYIGSPGGGEQKGHKGGPQGNNGVGNGEDPQPPGNPPINDGPGTGPGNPGCKGGAKK